MITLYKNILKDKLTVMNMWPQESRKSEQREKSNDHFKL
jgi:hypothetical protein